MKLDGMRLMMEQQKLNMESQINNKNVFDTMAEGTKAVQELAKEADTIPKFTIQQFCLKVFTYYLK